MRPGMTDSRRRRLWIKAAVCNTLTVIAAGSVAAYVGALLVLAWELHA